MRQWRITRFDLRRVGPQSGGGETYGPLLLPPARRADRQTGRGLLRWKRDEGCGGCRCHAINRATREYQDREQRSAADRYSRGCDEQTRRSLNPKASSHLENHSHAGLGGNVDQRLPRQRERGSRTLGVRGCPSLFDHEREKPAREAGPSGFGKPGLRDSAVPSEAPHLSRGHSRIFRSAEVRAGRRRCNGRPSEASRPRKAGRRKEVVARLLPPRSFLGKTRESLSD